MLEVPLLALWADKTCVVWPYLSYVQVVIFIGVIFTFLTYQKEYVASVSDLPHYQMG